MTWLKPTANQPTKSVTAAHPSEAGVSAMSRKAGELRAAETMIVGPTPKLRGRLFEVTAPARKPKLPRPMTVP